MKELTQEGLLKILTNLTNAMEITLVIDSPLKMKKTGNPHVESNIIKHTILNGVIGKNYKTEREKLEKKHEAKPRAWGTLINPYVIEHKGKHYLQVFVDSTEEISYTLEGEPFDIETVRAWIYEKSPQEITIKDIKFENIRKIVFKITHTMV